MPTTSNDEQSGRSSSETSYLIPTHATLRPCARADSANKIGNRPLPASSPIGSTFGKRTAAPAAPRCFRPITVTPPSRFRGADHRTLGCGAAVSITGWISRRFRAAEMTAIGTVCQDNIPGRLLPRTTAEAGDLAGQLAELAMHLRQASDHLEEPALLAHRHRRRAQHVLPVRDIPMDARLGAHDHPTSDLRVVLDARLAGHRDVI